MITSKLAKAQLAKNRRRGVITLLGIILSMSMITALAGFAESALDLMRRSSIATGGNWHCVFMNVTENDVLKLKSDTRIENVFTEEYADRIDVKFRIVTAGRDYYDVAKAVYADNHIANVDHIGFNYTLLMAEGVVDDGTSKTIYGICGVLIGVVIISSILVIANAFSISAGERVRQFGLLKSAGATKEQIRRIVLTEALILAAIAIPLGAFAGFLIEKIALEISNVLLREAINISPGW